MAIVQFQVGAGQFDKSLNQPTSLVAAIMVRRLRFGALHKMDKREITLGHSPDPDDAFMFYALATDGIDTGDLAFRHIIEDIETLNHRAMKGELDVTAISIHTYAYVLDTYALLTSGASMGDNYGPLVIARAPMTVEEVKTKTI